MEDKKFEFTYTAPTEQERREIERIRQQYTDSFDSTEGKLARIKKLDTYVKNAATCWSLVLGFVGMLIFGLGLTMVLEWQLLILGCLVALVGLPLMICAYPLYTHVLKRMKKKYGDEILRLSEELLDR